MSFRTVCPSHLVVVGKTRIACNNVWDKSCIRFLSLTTTEAQPQTWLRWGEIASKLNFVTWDDPRPKCLYNMCLQQWHFSAVSPLCVYISSPRLNRGLKSHRNDLTKKFEKSQVIIRCANSVWPWQWNDSNVRFISYGCCNPEAIELAHVLYSERLTSLARVEGQREKHDKAGRFKLFVNGSPKQQALYSRTLSLERTSLASKSMTGGCVRLLATKLLSVGARRTLASGYARVHFARNWQSNCFSMLCPKPWMKVVLPSSSLSKDEWQSIRNHQDPNIY